MKVKKVAVFNDTSFGHHFGCDAVMASIDELIERHGGRVVHRQPVGRLWRADPIALQAIEEADIVIVNGEGSIHQSSARARQLAALGPYCADRLTPCYLINATLQENDDEVLRDLSLFSHIWVRESASRQEMKRASMEVTVCGDLSLFHAYPAPTGEGGTPLVLDSVRARKNRDLASLASRLGADFVSMKHGDGYGLAYPARNSVARLFWRKPIPTVPLSGIVTFQDFASYVGRHSYLITGRFHGFCFAVAMGLPMSVLTSNTWKCEAMLSDVGLDSRRLVGSGPIPELIPLAEGERERIGWYLENARQDMDAMFRTMLTEH